MDPALVYHGAPPVNSGLPKRWSAETLKRRFSVQKGKPICVGPVDPALTNARNHAYTARMPCPYRAVLLITRDMEGTSSSVAKERIELSCVNDEGHKGPHLDARSGVSWEDHGKLVKTFLRHEDEPFKDHYP